MVLISTGQESAKAASREWGDDRSMDYDSAGVFHHPDFSYIYSMGEKMMFLMVR